MLNGFVADVSVAMNKGIERESLIRSVTEPTMILEGKKVNPDFYKKIMKLNVPNNIPPKSRNDMILEQLK